MNSRVFSKLTIAIIFLVSVIQVYADEKVTDYSIVPQHVRDITRVTNFDPRVQSYGWEEVVYLEPPANKPVIGVSGGYSIRSPAGIARISSQSAYTPANPQAGATIKVRRLDSTYNKNQRYEGWLVDEDTGYWLTFGVFTTDHFGNGRLNTATSPVASMPEKQRIYHSLDLFDAVAVTLEQYPDSDPRPSENVVLYGRIPKHKTFVTPEPTVQNKLFGVRTYYPSSSYANPSANLPKK